MPTGQGNLFFLQGQGKVNSVKWSGKLEILQKSWNFKRLLKGDLKPICGQFNFHGNLCGYLKTERTLQSRKEGKDQESIQSSTTPDPGYQWESDNVTIRHNKREPRGQPFPSRLPQGINKQTCMKT